MSSKHRGHGVSTEFNTCSFCHRPSDKVEWLIAGATPVDGGSASMICEVCTDTAAEIIKEKRLKTIFPALAEKSKIGISTPQAIKAELDLHVIGQEEAKRTLSVAVYNHYKRVRVLEANKDLAVAGAGVIDDVELAKSNILLIGPTGSGKTLLVESLARKLGVPFAVADATSLTEAGYVGEDVETMLAKLVKKADGDVAKAQLGIIYIDEIDKISRKSENASITRDVSGEGVQQALLKLIEGTVASVQPEGGRKHPGQEMLQVDTKNILFIVGGAFSGIDQVIKSRQTGSASIGFTAETKGNDKRSTGEVMKDVTPGDLIRYGLIPEFVGRLPVITSTEDLDEKALIKILTQPKNALVKQYRALFEADNAELNFTDDALAAVAAKALERKTGARGLRSIMEGVLLETMYELPAIEGHKRVTITADVVNGKAKPEITPTSGPQQAHMKLSVA